MSSNAAWCVSASCHSPACVAQAEETMDCWFTSGGSDSGVMAILGQARAKRAPRAPLIGIMPWGVVKNRELFMSETASRPPRGNDKALHTPPSVEIQTEDNHTHFLMVFVRDSPSPPPSRLYASFLSCSQRLHDSNKFIGIYHDCGVAGRHGRGRQVRG